MSETHWTRTYGDAAYQDIEQALLAVTGRVYQQAEHPAEVIAAAFPNATVYGWWGSMMDHQTGTSHSSPPGFVLWHTGDVWIGIMVRDSPNNRQGWRFPQWFHRAEILDRAATSLRAHASLLDLALHLNDPEDVDTMVELRNLHRGLAWGAIRIMDAETLDAFTTLSALRKRHLPGRFACDLDKGLWEQTAAGQRWLIEPDPEHAQARAQIPR